MIKPALKTLNLDDKESDADITFNEPVSSLHSLHTLVPTNDVDGYTHFPPAYAKHFITQYSSNNDIVLDPFSNTGNVMLEAALSGRVAYGLDSDEYGSRVAKAKVNPVNIVEIASYIQKVHLSKPIILSGFEKVFSPFYEVNTYREIINLFDILSKSNRKVVRFIEAMLLGILHGPGHEYLSVNCNPFNPVESELQIKLNEESKSFPEYRSVLPRILRKAAYVTRDCNPLFFKRSGIKDIFMTGNIDSLRDFESNVADIVVTSVPVLTESTLEDSASNWIRKAFLKTKSSIVNKHRFYSFVDWKEFIIHALGILHRVVKSNKNLVFYLKDFNFDNATYNAVNEFTNIVLNNLSNFYSIQSTVVLKEKSLRLQDVELPSLFQKKETGFVVLKKLGR